MTYWKQFKAKACTVTLAAPSKDLVLREVVDQLVVGTALPAAFRDRAHAALIERETLASTGVGAGVAIPHVKLEGIEETAASLCVHSGGVEWAAIDGEPVHVVFTVLRPVRQGDHHDPERHLEMMRWISRLARSADFRRFAVQAKTRSELVGLLKEMQQV